MSTNYLKKDENNQKSIDFIKINSGTSCNLFNQTYNVVISFRYSYRCKPIEIFLKVYKPENFQLQTIQVESSINILINLEDSGNYVLFKLIIDDFGIKFDVIEGLEFLTEEWKNKVNTQ